MPKVFVQHPLASPRCAKDCNGNPISTFPPYYALKMSFTALAIRLIQSISHNFHNKVGALKR